MDFDIRKKGKNMKAEEFMKEMKDRYKEAKAALIKSQEEIKRQVDRSRKEVEEDTWERLENLKNVMDLVEEFEKEIREEEIQ